VTIALIAGLACLPGFCGPQSQPAIAQGKQEPPPPEQRVDINHASLDELTKVPGLTRPWAQRIVRFRPYRTKQDLLDLGVVPGDVYNRIKDYVIAHQNEKQRHIVTGAPSE
jgi:DNA uptake protein ComE-like DNA-binding protein